MTDEHDPYEPIACDLHSKYELAIMRRMRLHLAWRDARGQHHVGLLLPVDLCTRNRVEYLVARDRDGLDHNIRLDRIIRSNVREARTA